METKYKVTLFISKFMKVGEDYQNVEASREFVLGWDGLVALLGCMAEGSNGKPVKIEFVEIKEEA